MSRTSHKMRNTGERRDDEGLEERNQHVSEELRRLLEELPGRATEARRGFYRAWNPRDALKTLRKP